MNPFPVVNKSPMVSTNLAILEELLDCKVQDWDTLQNITLAYCDITELPSEVSRWSAARIIYLSNNRLTALPETVSAWSAATYIGLSSNQLTVLPDGVSGWSAATTINLTSNQLTALPDGVAGFAGARGAESPASGWSAATCISLSSNSILFVDDDLCEKCRVLYGYDYGNDKYFLQDNKKKIQGRYACKIQKVYRQHHERRKAAAVVIQRHYKDYFYRVEGSWYKKVKGNYLQFRTV